MESYGLYDRKDMLMKHTFFRSLGILCLGAAAVGLCACASSSGDGSGSALTASDSNTIVAEADTALYLHTDTAPFAKLFHTTVKPVSDNSGSGSGTPTLPEVGTATYTATTVLTDEESGDIQLEGTLDIGKNSYPLHADGDVVVYQLDDTYSLIKGSLTDKITIGDTDYRVSINTNQLVGSTTLNAGLVLTPKGYYSNKKQSKKSSEIILHFGTPITETEAGEAYLNFLNSVDAD